MGLAVVDEFQFARASLEAADVSHPVLCDPPGARDPVPVFAMVRQRLRVAQPRECVEHGLQACGLQAVCRPGPLRSSGRSLLRAELAGSGDHRTSAWPARPDFVQSGRRERREIPLCGDLPGGAYRRGRCLYFRTVCPKTCSAMGGGYCDRDLAVLFTRDDTNVCFAGK